jgi:hypothetical protein
MGLVASMKRQTKIDLMGVEGEKIKIILMLTIKYSKK